MQGLVTILLFLFCVASTGSCHRLDGAGPTTFDVLNYGASGDGKTDDSKAFLKAWGDLCQASGSEGTPTLVVPAAKNFLLTPVSFKGPCKSNNVDVQIQGSIVAPDNVEAYGGNKDQWLRFSNVDGLTVDGGGTIDGRGSVWWNCCKSDESRPTALGFSGCHRLKLAGTRHLNSQRNHISINECHVVHLSGLHIEAPDTSPNTDGVDISSSSNVTIQDSTIATGDDCVAINGGSSYINITGVACGPGHGISVGSLGKNGGNDSVEEIYVRDCNFTRTTNGARIKTWQGWRGHARKITFERITLIAPKNPIIIDQNYRNKPLASMNGEAPLSSTAQLSDVTYRHVQGTSATERAIFLDCSGSGCSNIIMDHVNIASSGPGRTFASCQNAQGTQVSTSPNVPCLLRGPGGHSLCLPSDALPTINHNPEIGVF